MAEQSNDQGSNIQQGDDSVDPRQDVPRTGIPGKGFDAGTGYGGGGNDSLYSAESSYGGQSGIGGSRTIGAYAGEGYGRSDDEDPGPGMRGEGQGGGADAGASGGAPNAARDTDGRGASNMGEGSADPNVEAVTEAFEGQGAEGGAGGGSSHGSSHDDMPASGLSQDGPDAIDLEDFSGGSRREPGR